MVSLRCKLMVKAELDKLSILYGAVDLGKAELKQPITEEQLRILKKNLLKSGLEVMENKKAILIEKIKNIVVELIHYSDVVPVSNFSEYLHEKMEMDYTYLSNLFSEVTGSTIEQFVIAHKIERIKELLLYDELSISEISYKLNYSSVAHLSNQFKKVTGLSPSYFKKLKVNRSRIALEDV